jgi:N-acetylglucosaminyldiphosphoundecaprenol N-acetyl-beta-D-mannosaminyltransferase
LERIVQFIQSGTPHQAVTVNLRFLSIARREPRFAQVVNESALAVVDGTPLVWLTRLAGSPVPERVTGTDLLLDCAGMAAREGRSIYLLGARPGVAEEAARRLQQQFPGLRIAGVQHGYFSPDEQPHVVEAIRRAKPDVLFVAMGCPKQDYWIHDNLQALGVPVSIGIGGTLEVVTGKVRRAPAWMQRSGLEWLYRMLQEPRRLWRRYLLEDLPTTARVSLSILFQRLGRRAAA